MVHISHCCAAAADADLSSSAYPWALHSLCGLGLFYRTNIDRSLPEYAEQLRASARRGESPLYAFTIRSTEFRYIHIKIPQSSVEIPGAKQLLLKAGTSQQPST